jgi:uncharacterized protein
VSDLRTIRLHDGYAVYHSILGDLRVVDGDELPRLDEGPDAAAILEQRRRDRERAIVTGAAVKCVQLVLTNRCNFHCTYCFEGLGGTPIEESIYARSSSQRIAAQRSPANAIMTPANAERYLRAALALVREAGNDALTVQFFGGEPLVNWPALRHVLTTLGNGCDGVTIGYSIVTNGSIVTEEMASLFRGHGVAAIVSYDSPRSEARPMRSGRRSHDAVRGGLALLKRHDVRLAINAALTSATFDAFDRDLVDFAFDRGVYEIGVVLDLEPRFYSEHGTRAIADRLWDVTEYGLSKGVVVTGYWHQIFQAIASSDRYAAIGYQNCSAMGVQLSVEPSGDVFACKASGAYFGNILSWRAMLQSETYHRYAMRACTPPAACRGCEIEHFCSGLCLGAIEKELGGDLSSIEPSACDLYRDLTRRFIEAAAR